MKKLFSFLLFFAFASVAWAQTPQEIVSRMQEEMGKHSDEGVAMTVDAKALLIGTMTSRTYALGDKIRVDASMMGMDVITWTSGKTMWIYNSESNEVDVMELDLQSKSSGSGDVKMFNGITDGYDVTVDEETDESWYLYCKKKDSNTDVNMPSKMDLVVAKGTYMPLSLSFKMEGIKITMRDLSFGVTESQVTFNPQDYPGVKINDNRQ